MITTCRILETTDTDPYRNLALEAALLSAVRPGEMILYLWQNAKTVVIGKNQNAWKECRIETLEAAGGHLARRISGGGAVFHDLGNLNFTFILPSADFDVGRQTGVILAAVHRLGLSAEQSGRNDILVDGRKFSGNAYYRTASASFHHGTLLVNVDFDEMSRYLSASKKKLAGNGVASVRSRVANLTEFLPGLSIDALKQAMREGAEEVYQVPVLPLEPERIPAAETTEKAALFASPEWKYGEKLAFTAEEEERFPWGSVEVQFLVKDGRIDRVRVFTDALDPELPHSVEQCLTGAAYRNEEMRAALAGLSCATAGVKEDLIGLVCRLG